MQCRCVRQTALPNTSRLLADVLYHPERTAPFYRHPLRDLEAFRAAASEIRISDEARAALVSALRVRNPNNPSLERLAKPNTVAVMTGQQVGLFSGPAYTIYKGLHAARLASWLTENGIEAVPVFWLATEDHDFAEVSHAWVFNSDFQPKKLTLEHGNGSQPVGGVCLSKPPLAELRAALGGLPYCDEVCDAVERSYQSGATMGNAFSGLLGQFLERFGVLQVDPMQPEFRQLAAPALRKAVEAAPELTNDLLARNRELADAGYHAQVHVEDRLSLFFLLDRGKRLALRRNGNDYAANGSRFSTNELAARAADLSPNALLRPVIQDSMLPTVAYVGGPAEIAYLAQSQTIYRTLLDRMPVAVPRVGFTILDAHTEKRMDRYGLTLPDFFHGQDALRERISSRLVPRSLSANIQESAKAIDASVDRISRELVQFDPTLEKALESSRRKIRHQIGKIEAKAGREAMRRDERATRDAALLYGLAYPERHLQERLYSILPLLAQHGLDLIDRIHETIELDCPDHRVMVV